MPAEVGYPYNHFILKQGSDYPAASDTSSDFKDVVQSFDSSWSWDELDYTSIADSYKRTVRGRGEFTMTVRMLVDSDVWALLQALDSATSVDYGMYVGRSSSGSTSGEDRIFKAVVQVTGVEQEVSDDGKVMVTLTLKNSGGASKPPAWSSS